MSMLRCFGCDRTTTDSSLLTISLPSGRLLCADCRPAFDGMNLWGNRPDDVGEGYCHLCEREGGRHYSTCPIRPGASTSTRK